MTKISHQSLLDKLDYNPSTGQFTWKISIPRCVRAGAVAGGVSNKYWAIRIEGKLYYAHILAWFYVTGVWPVSKIDHCNGVKTENWFDNLRLATSEQNAQNCQPHSDSLSGFKGVRPYRKRFAARIRVNGANYHIGTFDTPELAAAAYDAAALTHFGQFARTNRSLGLIA